ncbi:SGNH/GDSL hydrolase family protein [Zooshikella sp. RANM57]|uniref:SGNH/GDSL hydrolase family protein n=1 Tax=Zooshikella sp. RANM57 TaxID=3425863 RepID=UPI003D6FE5F9
MKFIRVVLLMLCALPLLTHASSPFSTIIFFGDSLSDVGNKHQVTTVLANASHQRLGIRAQSPYFKGRFSNHLVWTDYLWVHYFNDHLSPARQLIKGTLQFNNKLFFPFTISAHKGQNWAIGGAQAGSGYFKDIDVTTDDTLLGGAAVMPNIGQQIDDWAHKHTYFEGSELISIQGGANNLWFTLFGELNQNGEQAARLLLHHIDKLHRLGARHILVSNIPALEYAPLLSTHRAEAENFINTFNKVLASGIHMRQQDKLWQAVNIYYYDSHSAFQKIINTIHQHSRYTHQTLNITLTNYTDSAWNFTQNKIVDNPQQYLFWDGLHPTDAVHHLMANDIIQLLSTSANH